MNKYNPACYNKGIFENQNLFSRESFVETFSKFLEFNEYKILEDYGKISRKQAGEKAFTGYGRFNREQSIKSDLDKGVKNIESKIKKQGNDNE